MFPDVGWVVGGSSPTRGDFVLLGMEESKHPKAHRSQWIVTKILTGLFARRLVIKYCSMFLLGHYE